MHKICDLHTHSFCSDGSDSPTELLEAAVSAGLSAVALCDHNTVSGLQEFARAAENKPIEAVLGVEITSEYNNKEMHILGLFLKKEALKEIKEYLDVITRRQIKSNREMIERMVQSGIKITHNEVCAIAGNAVPNRVHVANALVKHGYAQSVREAFDKFLYEKHGFYKPVKRLDALDVVGFLASVGAQPVIAHPMLHFSFAELSDFIIKARESGLIGLESIYPRYTTENTEEAQRLCEMFSLKNSGGSDYHGANRPEVKLGELQVPIEYFENLKP